MNFSSGQIIAFASRHVTLRPDDLFLTGTPDGVGFGRNPRRYMKPGSHVTVVAHGICGMTNPAGLTKLVPGFNFTESTYGAPVYTLRGIGTYDEAIAISPAVGVYVDQIPLPFARMTEGVSLDLQRVEVLKGPQGTLFGENSTGGAVNYIPNRPTDHVAAGGSVTYGRFDETDAEGYVSGPVFGTVNARLAVRTEQRGDWQYNYTNNDTLGRRHFTTGRYSSILPRAIR